MDISFEAVDVPGAEEIVQARMMKWASDVLDQKAFDRVPFDLIMQMNLLFEETPKDELIARLVARELARLNVDSGRDINKRASQDGDRSPQRRSSSGGYSRSGGYTKSRSGYKKSSDSSSPSSNGRKNRSSTSGGAKSGGKKYGGFGNSGGSKDSGGGFKKKSSGKGKRSGFGSKPFRG
jgi:hypothetical protein